MGRVLLYWTPSADSTNKLFPVLSITWKGSGLKVGVSLSIWLFLFKQHPVSSYTVRSELSVIGKLVLRGARIVIPFRLARKCIGTPRGSPGDRCNEAQTLHQSLVANYCDKAAERFYKSFPPCAHASTSQQTLYYSISTFRRQTFQPYRFDRLPPALTIFIRLSRFIMKFWTQKKKLLI